MSAAVTSILAVIRGLEWPPDQWRIQRPFTRLQQAGVDARWTVGNDAPLLGADPDSTVLVVPRQTGTDRETIDAWLAERRPKVRAVVYEADDLIFSPDMLEHLQQSDFMQGAPGDKILVESEMAAYYAAQCDGMTVSSEPLAEIARTLTTRPVIVVPNALDVREFRAKMAYRAPWADHLTIGWSGGRRPERDILPLARAWGKIAARYPHVRFVVAAPVCPDAFYREIEDDTRIIRLPWMSWQDYPVSYQTDIGCASVANTLFSRCKTPIKAMEYGIGGAAVVATPTLYGDIVKDGYTGLLAETADEWEEALSRLVEDTRLRRRLSVALSARVERHHNLDTQLHRWTDAYNNIVESMAGVLV